VPELLPRSNRGAQGVAALLDRLDEQRIECHSLMVVRHGHVVAEGWWAPFTAGRPHLLYSLTKSFTGVAAGIAIGDGLLALDTEVAAGLTVEHLLTMTAGHAADSLAEAWTLEPHDLVKGFLRVPSRPFSSRTGLARLTASRGTGTTSGCPATVSAVTAPSGSSA
jgi:CubicO group peptidase (beta-lactamase class C family)